MQFRTYLLFLVLCSHYLCPSPVAAASTAASPATAASSSRTATKVIYEEDDEDNDEEEPTSDPADPFGEGHNWVSFRDAPGVIEKEMESWDTDMNWINVVNEEGRTKMMEFAIQGRVTEVQGFVDLRGAPLNFQDPAGNTALHLSVERGHFYTSRALIQGNTDKSIRNKKGETVLLLACQLEDHTILELILSNSASIKVGGATASASASASAISTSTKGASARGGGASASASAKSGSASAPPIPTPASFAADPNDKLPSGRSALALASEMNNQNMTNLLLKFGAKPEEDKLDGGNNALFVAATYGHTETVRKLCAEDGGM
jgi:ribosomal protein L12E/L44/L45/RPP1/RPP2